MFVVESWHIALALLVFVGTVSLVAWLNTGRAKQSDAQIDKDAIAAAMFSRVAKVHAARERAAYKPSGPIEQAIFDQRESMPAEDWLPLEDWCWSVSERGVTATVAEVSAALDRMTGAGLFAKIPLQFEDPAQAASVTAEQIAAKCRYKVRRSVGPVPTMPVAKSDGAPLLRYDVSGKIDGGSSE